MQAFKTRNPLFQQDLFLCILDCLVAPEAKVYQFEEARPVLVSLARTCRVFSEPSLDRLWCKLNSLEPLIRCYAPVLDAERAKTPPSPTEWAIVHRYSHRIRELSITASRSSLHFLRATSLHPSLLVPNLRALTWNPSVLLRAQLSLAIILIQRLLSPSLVSLSVSLSDTDDETLRSFLANFPFLCSNLKSISIDLDERRQVSRTTTEVLSRTINHYEHLEYLDISAPVDDGVLMHVATSPKLKNLSVVLHSDKSNLHQVFIPSDATPFRNVEHLSLGIWDLGFVMTLLRSKDQMFNSCAVCHRSRPTTQAVFSFSAALASRQRIHSLRSIRLVADLDVESQPFAPLELDELTMRHYLSYDMFRPLSFLCHLRELVLDLGRWVSIDDDELISLTRNWPFLQVLRFNHKQRKHGYPWRSAKYITFKGLLLLLECCPDLHELSLPVDAREVPTDTGDVVCNPALTYIEFPESPISDAVPVHDILARHFPSVTEVCAWFNQSSDGEDTGLEQYIYLWTVVNLYIRL